MKPKMSMLAVIILMNRNMKILVYFAMPFPAGGRDVQWTDVFLLKTSWGGMGFLRKTENLPESKGPH
jgi:hypothetical protein